MNQIKKITFIPLAAILWIGILFSYQSILNQYLDVFFRPYGGLVEFTILAAFILGFSISYSLFVTFTQSLKYTLPFIFLISLTPFIFFNSNLSLVLMIGFLIISTLAFFNFQTNLKTYINFKPNEILNTPIRILNTLTVFSLSFGFYFHTNTIIQTQGFKLPEPLIDWAIDISLKQNNPTVLGEKYLAQIPMLTPEQLQLLKRNPQILESYGLSPDDLDQYIQGSPSDEPVSSNQKAVTLNPGSLIPQANLRDIIKAQISDSLESIIKPYLFAIPMVLAFMFYSLTSLILWLLSFFIAPLLTSIFYLLEKSGFIKFVTEMREVKKIVI